MLKENPVFLLKVAKAKLGKQDTPLNKAIHPNSKAFASGFEWGLSAGIDMAVDILNELIMENEEN